MITRIFQLTVTLMEVAQEEEVTGKSMSALVLFMCECMKTLVDVGLLRVFLTHSYFISLYLASSSGGGGGHQRYGGGGGGSYHSTGLTMEKIVGNYQSGDGYVTIGPYNPSAVSQYIVMSSSTFICTDLH